MRYGHSIVHHRESRKVGGNAPDNLITLCESCHKKALEGTVILGKAFRHSRWSTRDAAFMGIMRKTLMRRLLEDLPIPVCETMGYITKYIRVELLKLPKSHINDALAIAMGPKCGVNRNVERMSRRYIIRPVRHHNRQLHKATILKGGIQYFLRRTLDGEKVKDGAGYRHLTLLERSSNYLAA